MDNNQLLTRRYSVINAQENACITPDGLVDSTGNAIGGVLFTECLCEDAVNALINITYGENVPVAKSQQFDNVYGLGPNFWQRSGLVDPDSVTHEWDGFLASVLPPKTLVRPLELLRSLAPEHVVERLRSDGEEFPYLTLRVMIEGGYLGRHAHLEFYSEGSPYANDPVLSGLMPRFELSCLLMLQNADSGGKLRFFNAEYPCAVDVLSKASPNVIEMPTGSLLVFDAARIYHEVTPVTGRDRITAGFWLSYSGDKSRLLAWS
jgi:hypothetical protein